jgi:hypothetical protein
MYPNIKDEKLRHMFNLDTGGKHITLPEDFLLIALNKTLGSLATAGQIIQMDRELIKELEEENEKLRAYMNDVIMDDWFCQNNEQWVDEWNALLKGNN